MSADRRQFLSLLGVAMVGNLAGCNGGSSNSETDTIATTADTGDQTPTATSSPTTTAGESNSIQSTKFTPEDGDSGDLFGVSVVLSGDGTSALIGASGDEDPNGTGAGSAYVFSESGDSWSQQTKLTPDEGDSADAFGRSVSLSSDGSTALSGAWNDETTDITGSAYVFSKSGNTWSQQARLVPNDADSGDRFGWSVELSGDDTTALISASRDEDPNGRNAGSSYVFSREGDTWHQEAKLVPDDGDAGDEFGQSVGLSDDGTTALIGAVFNGDEGSAYVFSNSGGSWSQQTKLAPTDGEYYGAFGQSVGLSTDGATALIGASSEGSAYVFSKSGNTWSQQTKLVPNNGDSRNQFGQSVELSGDGTIALIGTSVDEDPNGTRAGSAYVFSRSEGSWNQQVKLAATDGDADDEFGHSVGLSEDGNTALIGAWHDENPNSNFAGSAYVFDM